jgi:hypothetical protein
MIYPRVYFVVVVVVIYQMYLQLYIRECQVDITSVI